MNMQSKTRTLVATLALALCAGTALAAPPAPGAAATRPAPAAARNAKLPAYGTLDTNRDGIVTLPEVDVYSRPLAASVRHCDADHNDKLSRDEYAACKPHDAAVALHDAQPAKPPMKGGGSR